MFTGGPVHAMLEKETIKRSNTSNKKAKHPFYDPAQVHLNAVELMENG